MASSAGAGRKLASISSVAHVSFDVPKGQFVGVLGRNGAGKSTLLRVVGGVHPADEKSCVDRWRHVGALRAWARRKSAAHGPAIRRDETLSVGDVFFSKKATQRMKEITRRGRIVIVVSHALKFIDDMCTRCLWLDQGKLVMDGPPADVTRAYQGAVELADEAELSAKFGAGERVSERPDAGRLQTVTLEQERNPLAATARAFFPPARDHPR